MDTTALKRGEFITVEVESVFSDGIVVSYPSKEGSDYRGALLHSQHQRTVLSQTKELANPLTYLHDHPYSNLQKYATLLRDKVPGSHLQHWNSHAISEFSLSPDTCSIELRHQPLIDNHPTSACPNLYVNSLLDPNYRSAVVEAMPERDPDGVVAPFIVRGGGRSAKYRAQVRLKEQSSKHYQRIDKRTKSYRKPGRRHKRFGNLYDMNRESRTASVPPVCPPSHTLLTVGPGDEASTVLECMQGDPMVSYSLPTSPVPSPPIHTLLTVGPADEASTVLEGMQGDPMVSHSLPTSPVPSPPIHTLLTVGPADEASTVLEGMQGDPMVSHSLPTSPVPSFVSLNMVDTKDAGMMESAVEVRMSASKEGSCEDGTFQNEVKEFSIVLDKLQPPLFKRVNGVTYSVVD